MFVCLQDSVSSWCIFNINTVYSICMYSRGKKHGLHVCYEAFLNIYFNWTEFLLDLHGEVFCLQ